MQKEFASAESKKAEEPIFNLTFDDGPNQDIYEILDILKEKNAKGTFFLIEPQIKNILMQ